jgi:3-hydroxyacyl-CoA dehydrogenase
MSVNLEEREGVAVLTLDNPPVNALGAALEKALFDRIRAALADPSVRALVIAGAGKHFSAGADIREFSTPAAAVPGLPEIIDAIENARKPVVAALHGTVAGGALGAGPWLSFLELMNSDESRALRHVFFAERQAQKAGELKKGTTMRAIRSVGVVGFGTMGGGIAMAFANAGIPVVVTDETQGAVDRGLARVLKTYEDSTARGRLSAGECANRIGLIQGATDYGALSQADLVIEAVFEEMDLKLKVFRRLDEVCSDNAILATNTSSLDVNAIAEETKDPSRVLGLHFFSPANIMKLVEVVRPVTVSANVLSSSLDAVKRIGKVGVVVGVCDGFVGNRMLYAYRRQADFLLEEGALPQQVDAALREFGMAMGPFQIGDLAGLDIGWRIRKRQAETRPKNLRYSPIADRLCELGRFGQKTGAGWYRYEKGSRTPVPDPAVEALVRSVSAELGLKRREITDEEIVERCFGALVNEGALLLEEGVAARAGDIDVIWIHGYGFPRYRGGPMHWADGFGLSRIAAAVNLMHADQGDLVRPSELLRQLARDGRAFAEPVQPQPG